jgi:hypothetical protein
MKEQKTSGWEWRLIESCVDRQILAEGAGNRPEITDGVALLERLRENAIPPRKL